MDKLKRRLMRLLVGRNFYDPLNQSAWLDVFTGLAIWSLMIAAIVCSVYAIYATFAG